MRCFIHRLEFTLCVFAETAKMCLHQDVEYADGATWGLDDCTTCTCSEGLVFCAAVKCENMPHNCGWMGVIEDQCCPICRGELCSFPVAVLSLGVWHTVLVQKVFPGQKGAFDEIKNKRIYAAKNQLSLLSKVCWIAFVCRVHSRQRGDVWEWCCVGERPLRDVPLWGRRDVLSVGNVRGALFSPQKDPRALLSRLWWWVLCSLSYLLSESVSGNHLNKLLQLGQNKCLEPRNKPCLPFFLLLCCGFFFSVSVTTRHFVILSSLSLVPKEKLLTWAHLISQSLRKNTKLGPPGTQFAHNAVCLTTQNSKTKKHGVLCKMCDSVSFWANYHWLIVAIPAFSKVIASIIPHNQCSAEQSLKLTDFVAAGIAGLNAPPPLLSRKKRGGQSLRPRQPP